MSTSFDIAFEEDVLAQCLRDAEYARATSRVVTPTCWGSKFNAWLWRTIEQTIREKTDKPTPRVVLAAARRDFPDDEERTPYVELAARMFRLTPEAPRAALGELERFVRFATLSSSMERAASHLERGEVEKAEEVMAARVSRSSSSYVRVRWHEEFAERQARRKYRREHPEEFPMVPTGIRRLDEVMIGLGAGELGLVMATTNKGKSMFLIHLGFHAIKCGVWVVHFTLEMPADQVAQRYDSRFTGELYKKFKTFDFTERELEVIDGKFERSRERFSSKLDIVEYPIGSCSVSDVESVIDDLAAEKGAQPGLIILDSADHLRAGRHYNDKRHEHTDVYERVSAMLTRRKVPGWSSTHAGRDWAEKTATAEAAGESYDKSRIASAVLTLNAPSAEKTKSRVLVDDDDEPGVKRVRPEGDPGPSGSVTGSLDLFLAKYRDGESKIHIPMETDFARVLVKEMRGEA